MKNLVSVFSVIVLMICLACNKDSSYTKHNISHFIGDYYVTCKGHQTLYIPGPNQDSYRYIDTFFIDTLTIKEGVELTYEGQPFQILKVRVKQYPYAQTSLFEVKKMDKHALSFPPVYDGYECKCSEAINFIQDSVFFHFSNVWMADQPNFNCRGIKKN